MYQILLRILLSLAGMSRSLLSHLCGTESNRCFIPVLPQDRSVNNVPSDPDWTERE
jgi:hypothetical protein